MAGGPPYVWDHEIANDMSVPVRTAGVPMENSDSIFTSSVPYNRGETVRLTHTGLSRRLRGPSCVEKLYVAVFFVGMVIWKRRKGVDC